MITSGVLYHASGTEPWTRCRLALCGDVNTDPSCCRACGECVKLVGKLGNCDCGKAGRDPALAAGCRRNIDSAALRPFKLALNGFLPQSVASHYAEETGGGLLEPRHFEALRGPVLSHYGTNVSKEHMHVLYRKGLALDSTNRFVDHGAMVAAVAVEMLRFLTVEWPQMSTMHGALQNASWPCGLHIPMSRFTKSSKSFDKSVETILRAARVPRERWPAAKDALKKGDIHRFPSRHSMNSVLLSDVYSVVQSAVEVLDAALLGGYLASQKSKLLAEIKIEW